MTGLTPRQLLEITEFVQKHHKFGYIREEDQYKGELGYCIKYIDACYDSRQGDYWALSFRGGIDIRFTTNAFGLFSEKPKDFPYTNLFDWIMALLKYEWEPKGKAYKFMWDKEEGPLNNSFPNGTIEKEWSDLDMIEAFCADLEGRGTQDTIDACAWIQNYRDNKNTNK